MAYSFCPSSSCNLSNNLLTNRRLLAINNSTKPFSSFIPMYSQWSFMIFYICSQFMLYILNKFVIFTFSLPYLQTSTKIVLSIVYMIDRPYDSFDKYWLFRLAYEGYFFCFYTYYSLTPSYCSSIDSTACRYSALISKSLSRFQNLFSISLYYSLSLKTQVSDLTMQQNILAQFQSIAFCQSTSSPLTPFLLATANKYLSPPSLTIPLTTSCQSLLPTPINELAMHFKAITEYQFLILRNEIMRQLPFIQVQVILFWGSVKLMSSMDRDENRLFRNYFQSQLVGSLVSQEAMVQRSTSMPENWEKRCWDFSELLKREMRMSELAYLLSSMILCLTRQLGMIRLARYSNSCLSSASMSPTVSVTFMNISISFRHFKPASYSSILFSSSSLTNNPTNASTQELSTIHTTQRQQISNN